MSETLNRQCAVCGTDLTIYVADDGTYEGGHYWPNLLEDDDREYWECEECYNDEGEDESADRDGAPDYQDEAVEIGRNPAHPRIAVQPSPWDPDLLLLWHRHDGEKWTGTKYLRADEARDLAAALTATAEELEEAEEVEEGDSRSGTHEHHRGYYSETAGWADDLPDLGEGG